MNKEDVKEIVSALQESQKSDNDKNKIIDWLFRGILTIIAFIGVGLTKDVNTLKEDVSQMLTEKTYSQEDIDDIKETLKEPRFTEKDADEKLKPIILKQERIYDVQKEILEELNRLKDNQRDTDYRLKQIEK